MESSMYFVKSTDTTAGSKKIHSIPAADNLMLGIKIEPGAIGADETLLILQYMKFLQARNIGTAYEQKPT